MALSVRDLVRQLGGPARVGRDLGVTLEAISNWSRRDCIPPGRLLAVWRLAQQAGLDWRPPGAEGLALPTLPSVHDTAGPAAPNARAAA